MNDDLNAGESLSSEEKAYFDSRGETEIKSEPAALEVTEAPEEPAEPDELAAESADTAAEQVEPAAAPNKTVPLAALTKTREELKAQKHRTQELEQLTATLTERWNKVLASQNEPAAEQPSQTDLPPTNDPVAAIEWLVNHTVQQQTQAREDAEQRQQREKAEKDWNTAYSKVSADYQAATKEDPTLLDAYQALWGSKYREMEALGYDPASINAALAQEEAQHIIYMAQSGKKPADYIKALAGARGWVAKAAEPAPDPTKELEKLGEAVDGATTLSGAGGEGPRTLTAQAIADMSPAEFEAWLSKPGNQQKFKRLAGG